MFFLEPAGAAILGVVQLCRATEESLTVPFRRRSDLPFVLLVFFNSTSSSQKTYALCKESTRPCNGVAMGTDQDPSFWCSQQWRGPELPTGPVPGVHGGARHGGRPARPAPSAPRPSLQLPRAGFWALGPPRRPVSPARPPGGGCPSPRGAGTCCRAGGDRRPRGAPRRLRAGGGAAAGAAAVGGGRRRAAGGGVGGGGAGSGRK